MHRSLIPSFVRLLSQPDDPPAVVPPVTPPADPPVVPPVTPPVADPPAPTPPVTPPAPVVPDKYDLKLPDTQLPDGSPLDPAIVERTAAIARELGLSNEAGQKLLDKVVAETVATVTARAAAVNAAWEPEKGAEWKKQNAAWKDAALKDPEVGGSPEKLAQSVEFAQRALKQFFPPETADFLKAYGGLGSNPSVLKGLAKIGRAMGEGGVVLGQTGATSDGMSKEERRAAKLFPNTNKPAAVAS